MAQPQSLTIELIDALLSPASNPNAESHYNSIPVPTRIQSLLTILQTLQSSSEEALVQVNDVSTLHRSMLTAVLLRREVSSLGGYSVKNVKLNSEWEIVRMLGEMVSPLLEIFSRCNNDGTSAGVRRQVGFVIAEVCSSLSVMEDGISVDVMNVILEVIAHGCSVADKASLNLLSSLAQQSPLSLFKAKDEELPSLLQSATSTLQQSIDNNTYQSHHQQLKLLESIQITLEAMNHISIASDMVYPKSLSSNPKERMVQLIQTMTTIETNPKKLSIQPNSNAAAIGKQCLLPLLNIIVTVIQQQQQQQASGSVDDVVQSIMQTLSHCASTCPSLLAGDLQLLTKVCQTLLTVGQNNCLDPNVRLSALEALTTLCMVPDMKKILSDNSSLRNLCLVGKNESWNGNLSYDSNHGIIGVCAELIVRGVDDDVDDWATEEVALQDEMQWENDDVTIFAESILDTYLRNGGGGSQSLPIVLSLVESLLKATEWQNIRAGLTILEACLNSSPHSFAAHVPVAVEAALSFCSHLSARVQFQAIQLLGSLCQADDVIASEEGSVAIREEYGMRILQSFAQHLSSQYPKIVCHACLGIVSFCRGETWKECADAGFDDSNILPYLGDVLNAISSGPLSRDISSNIVLYIRAFGSIACLADVVGPNFAPFYSEVIPGLMECTSFGLQRGANGLFSATGSAAHEIVALRGAAIEAATIVGQAMGDDDNRFHPEAEKIMSLIMLLLQYRVSNDSSPTLIPQDQLLAAAARISSIIGAAYTPYVPSILPHLLKSAKEETNVSITDGTPDSAGQDTDFDEETGMETITVSLPGMGVKKLVLNTSQIQEKSLAARAVYEHANSMGISFGPYTRDCFDAFGPLLQFKYSSEVRATAAQALGPIFDCACEFALTSDAKLQHTQLPGEMYSGLLLTIANQLLEEETDDMENLIAFSEALSNICYSSFTHTDESGMHMALLTQHEATQFTSRLLKVIGLSFKRRSDIISSMSYIFDADQRAEYEDSLSAEAEFLTNLIDSIGYNLKCQKEAFVPIFEECILPAFGPILTHGTNDPRARFGALCLFCDCVEHCGPEAAERYSVLLSKGVIQGLNDEINGGEIELKEVSVYGVSQIARHAPKETFSIEVGKIAPQLLSIAKEGESKTKDEIENLRLVENSASALATLSLFQNSPFSRNIDAAQKAAILHTFMLNLPLSEDEDEAKFCHEGFCELVEHGEIDMFANLDLLLKIAGQIAAAVAEKEDVATKETCSRLAAIITTLQEQGNDMALQQAYAKLSPGAQGGLSMLLGMQK